MALLESIARKYAAREGHNSFRVKEAGGLATLRG